MIRLYRALVTIRANVPDATAVKTLGNIIWLLLAGL